MLVPMPCEIRPLTPFSLKLATAKPIICAEQPATAAPPAIAKTSRFSIAVALVAIATQIAADDVGIVSKIPITTATNTPTMILTAAPASIAKTMSFASKSMSLINGHARNMPARHKSIIPSGMRIMSSLVLPAYNDAISTVSKDTTYAPTGLPTAPNAIVNDAPPQSAPTRLPANAPTSPVTAAVKITSGFAPSL